ncbi:MAG TPA: DUF1499 domain-containing protein [Burkholderiales bacterium]|jgi:uncharacterized protein (DUF1499 family)|nr:DUF1499 domain-containing protein [Burkholderiales bacterium]
MFSFKRPGNLGVVGGRLAPPKRTPNCVSSQADPADAEHYIAPITFRGDFSSVQAAVAGMRGATVIKHDGNYLYAEYRTPIMRYVDDVELLYDPGAGVVHVRSASRLGRRDFGVNRKRVEALRSRIGSLSSAPR